jgi:3-mercaptopyruvate sulfurtransferase SseA
MIVDRAMAARARLGDPSVRSSTPARPSATGARVEPLDPRAGHIPGAVNLPFAGNLEGGRFKDEDALRARFADVAEAATLVVYCGSGVSAAHDVLALELAGVRGARLYVERLGSSWSESAWVAELPWGMTQLLLPAGVSRAVP